MYVPLNQVSHPTDEQRHEMLRNSLENAGRSEDYEYIIKYLSPPPEITEIIPAGSMRGTRIGIIGGGLAGLCTAFELRKLGADITILEASEDRIGGRVYTQYFDDTYYAEFGALRIPISHETSWYYMNLFGLNTISMTPPRGDNFIYVHNTRLRTRDSIQEILYPFYNLTVQEKNTPWPELSSYAFHYAFQQLTPEIRAELIQTLPSYSPEILYYSKQSTRQVFESLGLSQGAMNLISAASPGIGAYLTESFEELLAEEYTMDYWNTYQIQDGNVNLPLAFYRSFQSQDPPEYGSLSPDLLGNVIYKAGHKVSGIYRSQYRNKVVIKYSDTIEGKDKAEIFDYCICTIPFSSLRAVEIKPYFSNMKMQAIMELNYSDAQKSFFVCNKRFWERDTDYGRIRGGISFTDQIIQFIFYPNDHNICLEKGSCSPKEPGVLLASYGLNQNAIRLGNMDDLSRYEVIRQNVEEVHGLPRGYLHSIVEYFQTVDWFQQPHFRGAFVVNMPGQKELFSHVMTQPEYNHRVYFAGEHISQKHGWIQGALYTAKEAANQLAKFYATHMMTLI